MNAWPMAALLALASSALDAQDTVTTAVTTPADSVMRQFEAALKWETGTVKVKSGLATIALPPRARFLGATDAERVLTKAWGNPPDPDVLGMIFPDSMGPFSENSWAIVITSSDDGYVKDDEAATLDYDKLLTQMQQSTEEGNASRKKEGFAEVHLLGWAEPPHYDRDAHKLYWAKRLQFSGEKTPTLNYDIRILGRRGVLVLSAIAGMGDLDAVKAGMPSMLAAVNFSDGNRYADFNPSSGDKVAAYGIAALIAGGVAAKAGMFKVLIGLLLAAKKFLVLAAVGFFAWIKKLLNRNKETTTVVVPPDGR
jgi:uncharacterized membrane-anchored protein